MKRFFSMFIAIIVVMGSIVIFASCDTTDTNNEDTKTTTAPQTTTVVTTVPTPVIPDVYKVYKNDDLSFVYPKTWDVDESNDMLLIRDEDTGNNINLITEPKHNLYDNLTLEQFNAEYKPVYEQMGMTVTNASVEHKEVNGIKVVVVSYSAEMLGVSMKQSQYMLTLGDSTYSLTITEMVSDAALALNVLNSLKAVK